MLGAHCHHAMAYAAANVPNRPIGLTAIPIGFKVPLKMEPQGDCEKIMWTTHVFDVYN